MTRAAPRAPMWIHGKARALTPACAFLFSSDSDWSLLNVSESQEVVLIAKNINCTLQLLI
jgi:hypothetical protein